MPGDLHFKEKKDFNPEFGTGFMNAMKRYRELNIDVTMFVCDSFVFRHTEITKFCSIMYFKELQRRLDSEGSSIITISAHPGVVYTGKIFSASVLNEI